ncbi:MAG: ABC transporter ATP-binding protein [Geminicoccaceae bacterium]
MHVLAAERSTVAASGDPSFPVRAIPFIWHYLRRRQRLVWSTLLLIGAASLCAVAVQYGLRLLVDAMMAPVGGRSGVWWPLALLVSLIAAESACWRGSGWLTCRSVVATGVDIRLDLFEHLSGHRMRYFADQMAGTLGGRITAAANSVGHVLRAGSWSVLPPCIDLLGAVVLFLTVDPAMAVALILGVAVLVSGLLFYGVRGRALHRASAEQGNIANGELVDAVANMWAVKAFAARSRERRRLEDKFGAEAAKVRRSWIYGESTRALHDAGLWVIASAMLVWCVHLWTEGRITPGEVVMVSALTFRVLHGSRELALAAIGMSQELAVVEEALHAIAAAHEVADPPRAKPYLPRTGEIAFEHVRFAHGGGRSVFEDFDLRIPGGQRVGLVGPSGAGKSTLTSLLLRLEDVNDGQILLDGQRLTSLTQDSLRDAIAVVPQEVSLFHRTILENIRYGRSDASDAEVVEAAKAASAHEFIEELPDGYASVIGERGAKLSGGQRQRLGIARAILKNAPILILDEATSALDSVSETAIQLSLQSLMAGRTVLAIAHRLSTLAALDRIVVLDGGRIVEDGPPADLLRSGGPFQHLWQLQAEGFEREFEQREAA